MAANHATGEKAPHFIRLQILATAYPLLEEDGIRHRDQVTLIGEQQALHRSYFLDLTFQVVNLDALPYLVELPDVDTSKDLADQSAATQAQRQRDGKPNGNQRDGNDVIE